MSRIVLASRDDAFEGRIREAFGGTLNGHVRRWTRDPDSIESDVALDELTREQPDVVAFGADIPVETALRLARMLDDAHPEITVVLVTAPTPRLWESALKAGVEVVVPVDAENGEMRAELERAIESAKRRRANLAVDADQGRSSNRVITVVSPKGGAGKSVVAVNLASGLAMAAPDQVVLVDLDLQFGDVAGALQLVPEHSVADAARTPELDLTSLKVFLTGHPDQLYVLCAPESPAEADEVTGELVTRVIELLSSEFRYVVIDTAAGIDEHVLASVESSTDLVLVGNMDVAAVKALRKEVQVLDQLAMIRQTRHFVLNRADSRVGLNAADVEATVGLRVDTAIPSTRAVTMSFNEGLPIIRSDPRSPASRELFELVAQFAEVPAEVRQPASGGLFSRRKAS